MDAMPRRGIVLRTRQLGRPASRARTIINARNPTKNRSSDQSPDMTGAKAMRARENEGSAVQAVWLA